jgi:hypothetical protein
LLKAVMLSIQFDSEADFRAVKVQYEEPSPVGSILKRDDILTQEAIILDTTFAQMLPEPLFKWRHISAKLSGKTPFTIRVSHREISHFTTTQTKRIVPK